MDTGMLSIGELAQAAGMSADTIRTWERRYGEPRAERLKSGHRRYARGWILRLRKVRELSLQGHRPQRLLPLDLQELEALARAGQDQLFGGNPGEPKAVMLDAIRRMDHSELPRLLRRYWEMYGALGFVEEVCAPLLTEVGEQWEQGCVSVAQEHFASEHIAHLLSDRWRAMQPTEPAVRYLFATLSGERHCLGLHMAAVVAALHGAGVLWLGADSPLDDVVQASEADHVYGVITSISTWEANDRHQQLAALRQRLDPSMAVVAGGMGAPLFMDGVECLQGLRDLSDFVRSQIARSDAMVS